MPPTRLVTLKPCLASAVHARADRLPVGGEEQKKRFRGFSGGDWDNKRKHYSTRTAVDKQVLVLEALQVLSVDVP